MKDCCALGEQLVEIDYIDSFAPSPSCKCLYLHLHTPARDVQVRRMLITTGSVDGPRKLERLIFT